MMMRFGSLAPIKAVMVRMPINARVVTMMLKQVGMTRALEIVNRAGHAPWIDELDHCASKTRRFLVHPIFPDDLGSSRRPSGGSP